MEIVKRTGKAFLVGGLLGLLAQIVMVVMALLLGNDSPLVIPSTLMIMCLFLVATFPSGLYNKWTEFGGLGALIPISGLTAGVAAFYCRARKATGSSLKGAQAGLMLVVRLSGSGLVASLVIALIISFLL